MSKAVLIFVCVKNWKIIGGPAWIRSERNFTDSQLQPMLQKLLADQFQVALHNRESGYVSRQCFRT